MQRRTLLLVVALALAGSAASFALKEPCTTHPWTDSYQYKHYCYSDILPLWFRFHLDDDRMPYLIPAGELSGGPVEYPVATGTFAWLMALATDGLPAYMRLTGVVLLAMGGLATFLMVRLGVPPQRALLWAAGPALVIHGLTNWDLLAVALSVAGWWAWRRGHPVLAAAMFGLGGAAKVYPAFFLPFLLLECLRERDRGKAIGVVTGGFLGLGLLNLVVWKLAPQAWWSVWTFHAARSPDFETPGEVLRELFDVSTQSAWREVSMQAGFLAMAGIGLWLCWLVWKGRISPLVAGAATTLAFMLFNRVYSPQYTLWAVPLLVLGGVHWRPIAAYMVADLGNFLVRYPYMTSPPGGWGWSEQWATWSHLFVLLRWALLAACMWSLLHHGGAFRPKPRAAKDAPSGAAPPAADTAQGDA